MAESAVAEPRDRAFRHRPGGNRRYCLGNYLWLGWRLLFLREKELLLGQSQLEQQRFFVRIGCDPCGSESKADIRQGYAELSTRNHVGNHRIVG